MLFSSSLRWNKRQTTSDSCVQYNCWVWYNGGGFAAFASHACCSKCNLNAAFSCSTRTKTCSDIWKTLQAFLLRRLKTWSVNNRSRTRYCNVAHCGTSWCDRQPATQHRGAATQWAQSYKNLPVLQFCKLNLLYTKSIQDRSGEPAARSNLITAIWHQTPHHRWAVPTFSSVKLVSCMYSII